MDYRFWVIPILLMIGIGGYYFGKKLSILFLFPKKYQKIVYYGVLYIVITCIIVYRSFLAAFLLYAILFYIVFDLLHFLLKKLKKESFYWNIYQKGIPVLIVSFGIMIYGIYNVNHPIVKNYKIELNKTFKKDLSIGMISDLHLGTVHSSKILEEIVEHANSLEVDLFILGGDIFDENTDQNLKEQAYRTLSQIKTKYGIYYIEGNHDLLTEEVRKGFEQYDIHILADETIFIDDSFYLIGRKDKRREKLGTPRKSLQELLKETDFSYPLILLDHQPEDQIEAAKLGVDLQLSGHTHAGQIFPTNYFLQYGYFKRENYQLIVSSGYGAWGFSFRTAGRSEMVNIHIVSSKEKELQN